MLYENSFIPTAIAKHGVVFSRLFEITPEGTGKRDFFAILRRNYSTATGFLSNIIKMNVTSRKCLETRAAYCDLADPIQRSINFQLLITIAIF